MFVIRNGVGCIDQDPSWAGSTGRLLLFFISADIFRDILKFVCPCIGAYVADTVLDLVVGSDHIPGAGGTGEFSRNIDISRDRNNEVGIIFVPDVFKMRSILHPGSISVYAGFCSGAAGMLIVFHCRFHGQSDWLTRSQWCRRIHALIIDVAAEVIVPILKITAGTLKPHRPVRVAFKRIYNINVSVVFVIRNGMGCIDQDPSEAGSTGRAGIFRLIVVARSRFVCKAERTIVQFFCEYPVGRKQRENKYQRQKEQTDSFLHCWSSNKVLFPSSYICRIIIWHLFLLSNYTWWSVPAQLFLKRRRNLPRYIKSAFFRRSDTFS